MSQSWNVDEDCDLNGNLDDSLSGLCIEMDNNSNFNMTDTLLALPLFESDHKPDIPQHSQEEQMISITLNAPTSPAMKIEEESLTYLNQGQPYELKFQYIGGSCKTQRLLKSYVKVAFHDRRLQYCEEKQIQVWRLEHPYERILEVDTPLSRGIIEAKNLPFNLNMVEILWDPCKTASVYIKINCISTEFTPKKHGGEKGVPFRLQIDTYILNMGNFLHIYSAYAQVKIFKPKGADRKHKTDKEKFEKQTSSDKCKYQPSCPFTILTETMPDSEFMCKPNSSSPNFFDEISSFASENQISSTKNYDKDNLFTSSQLDLNLSGENFKDKKVPKNTAAARHQSLVTPEKRRDQSVENIGATNVINFESHNQSIKKRIGNINSTINIVDSIHVEKIIKNFTAPKTHDTTVHTNGNKNHCKPQNSQMNISSTSTLNKGEYFISPDLHNSSLPNQIDHKYEFSTYDSFITLPSNTDAHFYPNTTYDIDINTFNGSTCGEHDLELELVEENGFIHGDNNLPLVLPNNSHASETAAWLEANSFNSYIINAFRNFSPLDMRRLSRQDLIDICGVADGIRLNNALQCIPPRARITLFLTRRGKSSEIAVSDLRDPTMSTTSSHSSTSNHPNLALSQDDLHKQFDDHLNIEGCYLAFHLYDLTREELFNKFCENYGASNFTSISQIYIRYNSKNEGTEDKKNTQIMVVANDKVIQHLPDGSRYLFSIENDHKQGYVYIMMESCESI